MVNLPNWQESLKISGQPGITREFFDLVYVSGKLHIDDILPESYRSAPETPEVSGGLAIAAVCCSGCPVAAACLWAASGVCQLASYAVEYVPDYMEEAAFVAMYLLWGDEMRSIVFEDQVRELGVARYGDRLSLINSPQP
ncbi:MAG: hypothetical protein Q4F00_12330 [bacterium]|nr:hypothetical protein [bacterium]